MTTGLVFVPHLDVTPVQRRGILTVPAEDAVVSCNYPSGLPCEGLPADNLPLAAHALGLYVYDMGKRFIDRMAARGYEWMGNLRLHGPWPSYEFNRYLADVESSVWREAAREDDHSLVLPYVIDRAASSPYSDYLLVGDFMVRNVFTEIIVPDGIALTDLAAAQARLRDMALHPKLRSDNGSTNA